jgi:hypothetical protein
VWTQSVYAQMSVAAPFCKRSGLSSPPAEEASTRRILPLGGVSSAALSRVINGSNSVRRATAERIRAVLEKLNHAAQHLHFGGKESRSKARSMNLRRSLT